MRKRTVVSLLMVSALAMFPANGREPIEGEESELVLRETPWTHLVVTLKGGKRVTYTREDVVKMQYLTQRGVSAGWMGRVWRMRETATDGRYCDGGVDAPGDDEPVRRELEVFVGRDGVGRAGGAAAEWAQRSCLPGG